MSLATRCTSCGTIFRVVQDQLKVSEGWVRCGRCHQVFNALEALFDLERETAPQRAKPPRPLSATDLAARGVSEFVASHLPASDPRAPPELPATHEKDAIESRFLSAATESRRPTSRPADAVDPPDFADARFPSEFPLEEDPSGADALAARAEPEAGVGPPSPAGAHATPLLERWRARRAQRQAAAAAPAPAIEAESPPPHEVAEAKRVAADPAPAIAEQLADDSSLMDTRVQFADESMLVGELPETPNSAEEQARLAELAELVGSAEPNAAGIPATPAFVRAAENAQRWHRPRVRASLALAATLLLGVLTVQVAVQFRDSFAARWPQARPTLAALCDLLGYEIQPLKRVAALSVDASGLSPTDASDTYRLTLTLRNRDQVELAAPSVELSLTDTRGTLIARRALGPGDFRHAPDGGPLGTSLPPGADTPIQAIFAIRSQGVSGYTVELFYP